MISTPAQVGTSRAWRSLMATTALALFIPVALTSLSCKREDRGFRVDPPASQPPDAVRLTDFVPATMPTTRPVALSVVAIQNDYENNAYAMAEGQRLFNAYNCNGCHANGGGGMGPPLIDEDWLYGSRPEQVYASIVQGRPNGMPAWGGRLPDEHVWKLTAFVRSMSGLVPQTAAPARSDHMKSAPPPNTIDPGASRGYFDSQVEDERENVVVGPTS
jgi:cytochrome c oxidase cbb3-type subunit III